MEQRALEGPGCPSSPEEQARYLQAAGVGETTRTHRQDGPWIWGSHGARFLQRPRVTEGMTEAQRDEGPWAPRTRPRALPCTGVGVGTTASPGSPSAAS